MKIHRLKQKGVSKFVEYIDSLRTDSPQEFPDVILDSIEYSEAIGGDGGWLDQLNLESALETAKGLDDIISKLGLKSAERDSLFWTWCSAYLFKRLCKKSNKGRFTPGELPIWVAEPNNWQRYYRHYLASIWQVFSAHKEKETELAVLLSRPVNTPGELWAQIAATQTLITNNSLIDTVYMLYWDIENGCRKRGSGGSSPRRLTQVLKQFERTYDFFAMSGNQIVELLPAEFDRYK